MWTHADEVFTMCSINSTYISPFICCLISLWCFQMILHTYKRKLKTQLQLEASLSLVAEGHGNKKDERKRPTKNCFYATLSY